MTLFLFLESISLVVDIKRSTTAGGLATEVAWCRKLAGRMDFATISWRPISAANLSHRFLHARPRSLSPLLCHRDQADRSFGKELRLLVLLQGTTLTTDHSSDPVHMLDGSPAQIGNHPIPSPTLNRLASCFFLVMIQSW